MWMRYIIIVWYSTCVSNDLMYILSTTGYFSLNTPSEKQWMDMDYTEVWSLEGNQ